MATAKAKALGWEGLRCALVRSPEDPEEVSGAGSGGVSSGEASGSEQPVRSVAPSCGDPLRQFLMLWGPPRHEIISLLVHD